MTRSVSTHLVLRQKERETLGDHAKGELMAVSDPLHPSCLDSATELRFGGRSWRDQSYVKPEDHFNPRIRESSARAVQKVLEGSVYGPH